MNRTVVTVIFVSLACMAGCGGHAVSRNGQPAARRKPPAFYSFKSDPTGAVLWVSTKRDTGYVKLLQPSGKQWRTPSNMKFNWKVLKNTTTVHFLAQWTDGTQSLPYTVTRGRRSVHHTFRKPATKLPKRGVEETGRPG